MLVEQSADTRGRGEKQKKNVNDKCTREPIGQQNKNQNRKRVPVKRAPTECFGSDET